MLPKNAVLGVHQEGDDTGLRDRRVSWCKVAAHSGGDWGPGFRLATTSEVSTSYDRRCHNATFDGEAIRSVTNRPYIGHLDRRKLNFSDVACFFYYTNRQEAHFLFSMAPLSRGAREQPM